MIFENNTKNEGKTYIPVFDGLKMSASPKTIIDPTMQTGYYQRIKATINTTLVSKP
jgi:hypothetical protein